MEFRSHCMYCGKEVEVRELVGGARYNFEAGAPNKYHLCPHPTDVWWQSRKSRPLFLPRNLPTWPSPRRLSPSADKDAAVNNRAPVPQVPSSPVGEATPPGITGAHPADQAGVPGLGECAHCGTKISASSIQDLCAACMSRS
jgi:hypothetical protein